MKLALLTKAMVAIAVCVVAMTACSVHKGNPSPSSSTSKFSFRIGDSATASATDPVTKVITYFTTQLKNMPNGRISITRFTNSELGTQAEMFTQLQDGSLDFEYTSTTDLSTSVPRLQLFNLPYLINSEAQGKALYESAVGKELLGDFSKKNVDGLFFTDNGTYDIMSTKKIVKPGDLHGQKIRISSDPVTSAFMKALGAISVPLPSSQFYSALQQHLVVGLLASPSSFYASKLYEVAKYVIMTEQSYVVKAMLASDAAMKRLPADLQADVRKAAAATENYADNLAVTSTAAAVKRLQTSGAQIVTPDIAAFTKVAKTTWGQFTSQIGQDVLTQAQAAVATAAH